MSGRNYLITQLQCSKCGRMMNLIYGDGDRAEKGHFHNGVDKETEHVSYMNSFVLSVLCEPCQCTLEAEEKLNSLKKLLGIKD